MTGSLDPLPYQHIRAYRTSTVAPTRLAVDANDNVYILEPARSRIVIRAIDGRITRIFDRLGNPISLAVDGTGRMYVGDGKRGVVEVYDTDGNSLGILGGSEGVFLRPSSIAIREDGTRTEIFVVDDLDNSVIRFDSIDGPPGATFGGTGSAPGQLRHPAGIAVGNDEIFIVDRGNSRIQVFTPEGIFKREIRPALDSCGFLCFFEGDTRGRPGDTAIHLDRSGHIFLAEGTKGRILVLSPDGTARGFIGEFGEGPGRLRAPTDMVIDSCDRLFVASSANSRVEIYGLAGHADPETHVPADVDILSSPVDPVVDTTLLVRLEVPGYRAANITQISANGFAQPTSESIGDHDRNSVTDINLVFGTDLVSSFAGQSEAQLTLQASIEGLAIEETRIVRLLPTDTDSDGDGVPDIIDLCSDTGTEEFVNADGCSVAQICPCEGPDQFVSWNRRSDYVHCVRRAANALLTAMSIDRNQLGSIMRSASAQSCGQRPGSGGS